MSKPVPNQRSAFVLANRSKAKIRAIQQNLKEMEELFHQALVLKDDNDECYDDPLDIVDELRLYCTDMMDGFNDIARQCKENEKDE